MSPARYLARSLVHHRHATLGVFAGAVLGATVLLGALFAGASVRASLARAAEQRTGQATQVVTAGDRFFRAELAPELAAAAGGRSAPLLLTQGSAVNAGSQARAGQVQILGVTPDFWTFAPRPAPPPEAGVEAVAVNLTLVTRLGLKVGDTLVVRFPKPGVIAGNAPIAGAETALESLRGKVAAVIGDDAYGRFGLEATQLPPATVYLPLARLQEALEQPGRANLVLYAGPAGPAELAAALGRTTRLADHGLSLVRREAAGAFELISTRIFIDPEVVAAARRAWPEAEPVTTYLVNEFRKGEQATPYSMATATTAAAAPFLPADLGPRELVLNAWLAQDLGAAPGDEVQVTYFRNSAGGGLAEAQAKFRVRAIVPLSGLAADRAWMPDFPGITATESPREWNPSLPLDLRRIRDRDEKYWEEHRGAPKAFLSAAAAEELWATRWGSLTGLRVAAPATAAEALTARLTAELRPEMSQLLVRPFVAAATPTVDFAGLFLGLSLFLIVAALGLVALLFQFALLQRNREDALLGAVGVGPGRLLRWRLAEGAALLALGGLLGLPLASLYTQGILRFLEGIWAGGTTFAFAAPPLTIGVGLAAFLLLSLLALWLAIRRLARRALSIRLAAQAEEVVGTPGRPRGAVALAVGLALVAAGALAGSGRVLPAQGAFFLAGFALLGAGLAVIRILLGAHRTTVLPGAAELGRLNLRTRPARSLTVTGLIATAVFMVLSVAAFRKQVGDNWRERGAGTGGFVFWVETTAPQNPARDALGERFELFAGAAKDLGAIVPLRAGAGDNANCFNLNAVARPRLLAVDPARLPAGGVFSPRGPGGGGWEVLQAGAGGAEPLPAFVDENTLLWALQRRVGDVIDYTDENGRSFGVRIAGVLRDSIFQGYLIVDEAAFLARFPSHPGPTVFLVDAPATADLAAVQGRLRSAAADAGGRVETTRDLLVAFHRIENTYLAIFNVLGTLGVILGSLGLAIVVARNLRERRGEFAVLAAIGLPPDVLGRMVRAEFGWLVTRGVVLGAAASALATAPVLPDLPAGPTVALVVGLLGGILGLNYLSGWLVFRAALRDLRPGMGEG